MLRTTMQIQGKTSEWEVNSLMSQPQIDGMREDGLEIFILEYSIPAWVADNGLSGIWCFFEDVFRFRNPFRQQ